MYFFYANLKNLRKTIKILGSYIIVKYSFKYKFHNKLKT